ncbi:OmpA family protein [Pseudooceanicola sp. CBS1P-1]|uniref:OmpA family protein n=1 Tax=Pseudooceanicola albus TaxID=2692189 RepID=A0A6L7FY52_9RHOB|nr:MULTISPECIES: OmpA family protein [Pseudooceanicola]MBT9383979.1 OmpA family protein [Pseudooceanicola endophyticus]MXN16609.1 OmpA family protein [Pseudooceanicola albus]
MTLTAKKSILGLTGASLLLLAACDQNDGYRNTRTGAAAGAGFGAVVGSLLSDDKGKGAAIGAVVGGIAGSAYGNYLDKQEASLRGSLGNDVQIQNTGSQLILTMPQDILFATDSATLRPDLTSDLQKVAQSLNEYPATRVQVVGHTDNTGTAAYNQQLSQRRAASVANTLINYGVSSGRISAFGRGEDQPKASNLTAEGRQQNRRVEIVIIPTGQN